MGSLESFENHLTPENLLRARNFLQISVMQDLHESPEDWVNSGDAAIAAHIFDEEPAILSNFFMFEHDADKLKEIIIHFEELIENHRTIKH